MKISGLDALARQLGEVEKAVAELDGDLAHVKFNPEDPQSIEQAIAQLNATIDEKIARYSHNDMVAAIADELKENGRSAILERAAEARLNPDDRE
jgi:Mg/Co/Ni transporter MgtE